MATVRVTLTELPNSGEGKGWIASWPAMANGDVGEALELPGYQDRSIQAAGTFGTGGSVAAEGSNEGTNYAALRDPSSTTIALTAAGVKGVLEATRYIRPHVTAGDGTTALNVTMFFVKPAR